MAQVGFYLLSLLAARPATLRVLKPLRSPRCSPG
jgi:hypothetical protein